MKKGDKDPDLSDVIGGTLDLFGLKIDLGKLLSTPEELKDQLEELREKLKGAGGREALSDEEWRGGGVSISGHFKTKGVLGEREYHIGTSGPSPKRRARGGVSEPSEAVEPPVDVFHEAGDILVIADIPGVELADLDLGIKDDVLSLATKPAARRSFKKEIKLPARVEADSLKASCRNGTLEVRLRELTS